MENVKGLTNHDRGRTFETILNILDELNYKTYWKILNSKNFGVPQNRERVYIVGFDKERFEEEKIRFHFPKPVRERKKLKDILGKKEVSNKYYLSQKYLDTLKAHKERHKNKGNGFGFEILDPEGVANTVMAGGMGRERNLIIDKKLTDFNPKTNKEGGINKDFIRTLTPREWARLQGFPENFKIPVSDAQAYKQFGNSVTVPVIYNIAEEIIKTLDFLNMETEKETEK